MSPAHSVFKQNAQNVHQLQQHRLQPTATCTTRHSSTRLIDSTANRPQRAQAPVSVISSYCLSPKSLLTKRLNIHFVLLKLAVNIFSLSVKTVHSNCRRI